MILPTYTDGDLSEHAGSLLAINCLNAILNASSQAECMAALQVALSSLTRQLHPERAIGGFAVVMVNVIERGIGRKK